MSFPDQVHGSQAMFRAVLEAMAHPGTLVPVPVALANAPFSPVAAAVALTLADHETCLWLDAPLASRGEVSAYLRFATGTRITSDPATATFALIGDPENMPPLSSFAQGTPEYPDRSTTVIVAVEQLETDGGLALAGPGIAGSAALFFRPAPHDLKGQLAANRARFPMGVDLILCAPDAIAALPRSCRVVGGRQCT